MMKKVKKLFDLVLNLDDGVVVVHPASLNDGGSVVLPAAEFEDGTIDAAAVADTDISLAIKDALRAEKDDRSDNGNGGRDG